MNDEPPKKLTLPDLFRRMAERLERNADDGFGGCFLICPPAEGGAMMETLIVDATQNPTDFWILLKSKCDAEIRLLDERSRNAQAGFGRR